MIYKKTIAWEILFLILAGASSIYSFDIGQWKAYVRLFGIIEILLLSAALVLVAVRTFAKRPWNHAPLLLVYGILSVLQLFPMVGALILGDGYAYAAAIHLSIIILGALILAASAQRKGHTI